MTYTVHRDTHEARAFDNLDQFDGVEPGDRVAVLVDPDDPETAFSVVDVRERTNSGIGLLLGLVLFAFVSFVVMLFRTIGIIRGP